MSRNQNRLLGENAQPQPEDTSSVPAFLASTAFGDPSQPQISQGLNFVTPTEFVALPSRGRYYPEGHPLQGVESVEMSYMTAKEEDILTSKNIKIYRTDQIGEFEVVIDDKGYLVLP